VRGLKFQGSKKQLLPPFRKNRACKNEAKKTLKHEVQFWRKSSRSSLCGKGQNTPMAAPHTAQTAAEKAGK